MQIRLVTIVVLIGACGSSRDGTPTMKHPANPETAPASEPEELLAAEAAAYERAKPVFAERCARCHSSAGAKASHGKLEHFNIDTYPLGGHHATEIGKAVRIVLGAEGEEATMPMDRPGSVTGEELEAIVEWSRAFDVAQEAGLHDHAEHGGHHGH